MARRNYKAMKDAKLQTVYSELINKGDSFHRADDPAADTQEVAALLRERGLDVPEADEEPAPQGPRMPFAAHLSQGKATIDAAVQGKPSVMEPKVDGWFLMVERVDAGVRAWLRSGEEATHRLPFHRREWETILPVGTILVGELCTIVAGEGGLVSGSSKDVHTIMRRTTKDPEAEGSKALKFLAFDCLRHLHGDLIGQPLRERQDLLKRLLIGSESYRDYTFDLTHWQEEPSEEGYANLIQQGWEGAIVKHLDAPYVPGARGYGQFKLKAKDTVDVVVINVHEGNGEFQGMAGALVVGQHDSDGVLVMRGRVSSGLDHAERRRIWAAPEEHIGRALELRHMGVDEGFRHPVFLNWRDDLDPATVMRHDGRVG